MTTAALIASGALAVALLDLALVRLPRVAQWRQDRRTAKAWEARTLRVVNARPTTTEISTRTTRRLAR
jgi:hypothetical protein